MRPSVEALLKTVLTNKEEELALAQRRLQEAERVANEHRQTVNSLAASIADIKAELPTLPPQAGGNGA